MEDYVDFGSTLLYVSYGEKESDMEKIYKDDLSDGIASMAKEQIDAWRMEIEENKDEAKTSNSCSKHMDKDFLRTLSEMCKKCLSERKGITRTEARTGFFGTKTRVQPRLQSEQAARNFDAKVRKIQSVEDNLRKMKVMTNQVKNCVHIINEQVEGNLENAQNHVY